MYRPIAKYVVRVALFASALAAIACSTPTAPSPAVGKKPTRDVLGDTLSCRSGYSVQDGRYVCNGEGN
jgi:hypothetical protein